SLGRSETLLYRAHFPWFYAAASWALLLAFLLAAGAATAADARGEGVGGLIFAGGGVFAGIMLPLRATRIGGTHQRFTYKRRLRFRATHELQLRAIEEVTLQQGIVGRIFDFGRLQLHGTGVDDIRLPTLADPLGLRKALQDGMATANQASLGRPAMPPLASGSPSTAWGRP